MVERRAVGVHSDGAPRDPRPAATVVILRRGDAGLEVLLTIRPKHMRFMGGAAVFPGGAIAAADLDTRWDRLSNLAPGEAARRSGIADDRLAVATHVCAIREAFEEVGLLLVEDAAPERLRSDAHDAARFLEHCDEEETVLDTRALASAGRWVTPLGAPVRFDTHFFLTEAPQGWEPIADPREVEDARWIAPQRALDDLAAGKLLMAPPTVEMLQRLATASTPQDAITDLAGGKMDGPGAVLTARLSPLVQVVLAPNPGMMTGPGTNTYIVGSGPTVVIDPAVPDEGYLDAVLTAAGEVSTILVTHRHDDHVGGVAALRDPTGADVRAWGRDPAGGVEVVPLEDAEEVVAGGAVLRALHTPGHASDHVVFLLEGAASLFAGDAILGEGTAVIAPPDGDMRAHLGTLRRLERLHIDRIYPGHFRPLDGGTEVVRGYIQHRLDRETAILAALRDGPLSVEDIVSVVYVDTPAVLHGVAAYSVLAHLELAESEGRVQRSGKRWRLPAAG